MSAKELLKAQNKLEDKLVRKQKKLLTKSMEIILLTPAYYQKSFQKKQTMNQSMHILDKAKSIIICLWIILIPQMIKTKPVGNDDLKL